MHFVLYPRCFLSKVFNKKDRYIGLFIVPTGYETRSVYRLISCIKRTLYYLYITNISENSNQSKSERNVIIKVRFEAGETLSALARDFGISVQRVRQIIKSTD